LLFSVANLVIRKMNDTSSHADLGLSGNLVS
jgi:hypothetical protein